MNILVPEGNSIHVDSFQYQDPLPQTQIIYAQNVSIQENIQNYLVNLYFFFSQNSLETMESAVMEVLDSFLPGDIRNISHFKPVLRRFVLLLWWYDLRLVQIPLLEKEISFYSLGILTELDAQVQKGMPSHLYNFPKNYETEQCGMFNSLK